MIKKVCSVAILLVLAMAGMAQSEVKKLDRSKKFYAYWGWNRSSYTKSDIRVFGDDHDITLSDVEANDLQSKFDLKTYFFVTRISIPQTNLKVGYYLNEKYSVAAGFDHMKYKIVNGQTVKVSGTINRDGSPFNGNYDNQDVVITNEFLRYNHTDGLNYVFGEINRHDEWLDLAQSKLRISSEVGVGIALLRPRTDVVFLSRKGPNVYHNAGYGVNAKVGVNLLLFNHISIMSELKPGYINMQHIQATAKKDGHASQHFGFLQYNILLGATFGIK